MIPPAKRIPGLQQLIDGKQYFLIHAALLTFAALPCTAQVQAEDNFLYHYADTSLTATVTAVTATGRSKTTLDIPQTIGYNDTIYTVTAIGDSAFAGCTTIQSITYPSTLTAIGACAFQNCSSLSTICIPDSIKYLGRYAFQGCTALSSIILPNEPPQPPIFTFAPDAIPRGDGDPFDGIPNSLFLTSSTAAVRRAYQTSDNWYPWYPYFRIDYDFTFTFSEPPPANPADQGEATLSGLTAAGDGKSELTVPFEVLHNARFYTVSAITPGAFAGNSTIHILHLDSTSVTDIPTAAFADAALQSVTFPALLSAIGVRAFAGSALSSVTLPDDVTTIGDSAFHGCTSLTDINLSDAIMDIAPSTFQNCSALRYISLPATLRSIGDSAFQGCAILPDVLLPTTLTAIGTSAFQGCSSLTALSLPPDATLGASAFAGCSALDSIALPPIPLPLADDATARGTGDPFADVSDAAFRPGSALRTYQTSDIWYPYFTIAYDFTFGSFSPRPNDSDGQGEVTVTGLSNNGAVKTALAIPFEILSEARYYTVTAIAPGALANNPILNSVDLSATVIPAIPDNIFQNCRTLTAVTLPVSITTIGVSAFQNCALTTIDLPDDLTAIYDSAFAGTLLTTIDLPDGLTTIGASAFAGTLLTDIDLPDGLTTIAPSTFAGCTALKSIVFPTVPFSIGEAAFQDCNTLPAIALPDILTVIGTSAFQGCSSLTALSLPPDVTLGASAFAGCSVLDSIALPSVPLPFADDATARGTGDPFADVSDAAFRPGSALRTYQTSDIWYPYFTIAYDFTFGYSSPPADPGERGEAAVTGLSNDSRIKTELSMPFEILYNGRYYIVTTIADNAFAYNDILRTFDLSATNITTIGRDAFLNCIALKTIALPTSLTAIGPGAFFASALTSITLPAGITAINEATFQGCADLQQVSLPDALTTLGTAAFQGCTSLKAVTLPATLNPISISAFAGCSSLSAVVLPDIPPTFAVGAVAKGTGDPFFGVSATAFVTASPAITDDYRYNLTWAPYFNTAQDFTFTFSTPPPTTHTDRGTAVITGFNKGKDELSVPSEIFYNGRYYIVAAIADNALADNAILRRLDLTGGAIKSIGKAAFRNCTALQTVVLPPGLINLGDSAFAGSALLSISLPVGLSAIGEATFLNCTALTSVDLSVITTIGAAAFRGCSALPSVTLPQTLSRIGAQAFVGCTSLGSITLPNVPPLFASGVTPKGAGDPFAGISDAALVTTSATIEESYRHTSTWAPYFPIESDFSFVYNESTATATIIGLSASGRNKTALTVPAEILYKTRYYTITAIGDNALADNAVLQSLVLPAGIISVGESAFRNCTALQSLALPDGVVALGATAFRGCTALLSVTLSAGLTTLGERIFMDCSALTSVTLPPALTAIGVGTFSNCTALSDLALPATLRTISNYAFSRCVALRSLTLPENLTTIGAAACYDCFALTDLKLPTVPPAIGTTAFTNIPASAAFHCACEDFDTYYDHPQWQAYRSHLLTECEHEFTFTYSEPPVPGTAADVTATITGLSPTGRTKSDLVVPREIFHDGHYCTVIAIAPEAFADNTSLHILRLGETSISDIGRQAFQNAALQSITLPNIPISIREAAFAGSALQTIDLPEGVSLGNYAFQGCVALTNLSLPYTMNDISIGAFAGCTALQSLTLPDNLIFIGATAFQNCTALTTVSLPPLPPALEADPFDGISAEAVFHCLCEQFDAYYYHPQWQGYRNRIQAECYPDFTFTYATPPPADLFERGAAMLTGITTVGRSKTALIIPREVFHDRHYYTVIAIGEAAFQGCTVLQSLHLPAALATIGRSAFQGCSALTSVFLPDIPPTFASGATPKGDGDPFAGIPDKALTTSSPDVLQAYQMSTWSPYFPPLPPTDAIDIPSPTARYVEIFDLLGKKLFVGNEQDFRSPYHPTLFIFRYADGKTRIKRFN
jgi:hypothetical protein